MQRDRHLETGHPARNRRLTRAGAEAILHLDFQAGDHEHMSELLERAKDGSLSPEEAIELENYPQVGTTLELMQSRARLSLKSLAAR